MATDSDENNFQARPPLGLPTGSVRAILTLQILAVVIREVALGRQVAVIWTETLVIALAHYFTSRRFVTLPWDVLRRLQAEGYIPKESNPLGLPRHSIRAIIMLSIGGLGAYLYREHRLLEPQVITIFGTVLCYLLGVFINGVTSWWTKDRKTRLTHFWEDMKAVVVVVTVSATASLYFLNGPDMVPEWLQTMTVGLVLFYFGSR